MHICGNCGTGLVSPFQVFCSKGCELECTAERVALAEARRAASSVQALNRIAEAPAYGEAA
jgi:hypothetical protein